MNHLVRMLPRIAGLAYRHRHSILRGMQRGAKGTQEWFANLENAYEVVESYLEATPAEDLAPEKALAGLIKAGALELESNRYINDAIRWICRKRKADPLNALKKDLLSIDTKALLRDLKIEDGRVVNYLETLCRLRMG